MLRSATTDAPATSARTDLDGDPLVSVVVPLYNGKAFIAEALSSILRQSYRHIEAVIVDDGSTDDGGDIVASQLDERVIYARQRNRGIAAARNLGIKRSRGAMIAFLDQDDRFHQDKLAQQVPALLADMTTGVVYSEVPAIDEAGKLLNSGRSVFHGRPSGNVLRASLKRNIVPATAGILVRRTCFDEAGLFDESLSGVDDWEMWTRLAAITQFRYLPIQAGYARFHRRNTSNDVGRMFKDGEAAIERMFTSPLVLDAVPGNEIERLRRRSIASLNAYCATRQLLTATPRSAAHYLIQAIDSHPGSMREWALLGLAALGYVPHWVKRRLI